MGRINMNSVSIGLANNFKDLLKSHSEDKALQDLLNKSKKIYSLIERK